MERLTEKLDQPYVDLYDNRLNLYEPKGFSTDTQIGACIDKLGKLEDIEEELGCPLEVVFKAITQGISYELKNGMMESEPYLTFAECGYGFIFNTGISNRRKVVNGEFQTKDYKKTWWLKEDRSE